MEGSKGFSGKALVTLVAGLVIIAANRNEQQSTKADLLNHSDLTYSSIGSILAVVGGIWLVSSVITHKK